MRAVLQRASAAKVVVAGELISEFNAQGIVALVGVTHEDTSADAELIAKKIASLRILDNEKSVLETGAPVIIVSQFTLYADTKKGRRPSWNRAAPAEIAEPLITAVITALQKAGVEVGAGVFGAHMEVSLTNDGPVTILIES